MKTRYTMLIAAAAAFLLFTHAGLGAERLASPRAFEGPRLVSGRTHDALERQALGWGHSRFEAPRKVARSGQNPDLLAKYRDTRQSPRNTR